MRKMRDMRKSKVDLGPDEYNVTDLTHHCTEEILGKVQHRRLTVTIFRYGQMVARIIPVESDNEVLTDPSRSLQSPTRREKK